MKRKHYNSQFAALKKNLSRWLCWKLLRLFWIRIYRNSFREVELWTNLDWVSLCVAYAKNLSGTLSRSGSSAQAPCVMRGEGACVLRWRWITELLSLRTSVRFRCWAPQPWFIWSSSGHVQKQNARQLGNISDKSLCVYVCLFMSSIYIPLFNQSRTSDASLGL